MAVQFRFPMVAIVDNACNVVYLCTSGHVRVQTFCPDVPTYVPSAALCCAQRMTNLGNHFRERIRRNLRARSQSLSTISYL
eukprot:m.319419 g.319419  ORF g.319419 m.319419 type:complete len:81 (+) comp20304_c0_seq3:1818-2060(+)